MFGVNKLFKVQKVKLKLPSLIEAAKAMGYNENTTMYEFYLQMIEQNHIKQTKR